MKLSALVITKNEERQIGDCLATLTFADEIIVIDSGSTDKTVAIAKQYTDKVYERDFEDFGAQKNHAISKASGEWILFLDADERVSQDLANEIRQTILRDGPCHAYHIPRLTYFLGKKLRFVTRDDRPIRLFKRGSGQFVQPIHEYFRCTGPLGDLRHAILHHTTPTVEVAVRKIDIYTDLEARFLIERKTKPIILNALKPLAIFLNIYLIKLGFLDGLAGFQFAYLSAVYMRQKYQKFAQLSCKYRRD